MIPGPVCNKVGPICNNKSRNILYHRSDRFVTPKSLTVFLSKLDRYMKNEIRIRKNRFSVKTPKETKVDHISNNFVLTIWIYPPSSKLTRCQEIFMYRSRDQCVTPLIIIPTSFCESLLDSVPAYLTCPKIPGVPACLSISRRALVPF